MSLSKLYPVISPSLLLDFAATTVLDPRITFTRSTTAVYYDGVTTALAEQNLLTFSQEFNNPAWFATFSTITANSTTAPDGTVTADTLTEDSTTNEHRVTRTNDYVGSFTAPFTVSVFVKANTRSFAYLYNGSGGAGAVFFNLSTGTIGTNTNSAIISSPTITAYTGSWYRISAVFSNGGGGGRQIAVGLSSADNTLNYLGNGTGNIFVWGFQLEQRSTATAYTPTTTAPITNYIPVLLTAPAGQARFDHVPTTGVSLGLLIEEARTNIVLRSADFANAAWVKQGTSITASSNIAPDGTQTASTLTSTTSVSQHNVYQNVTTVANTVYTLSFYVKAISSTYICAWISQGAGGAYVTYNLATQTVASSGVVSAIGTFVSSSIQSVGNGWYRISVSGSGNFTSTNPAIDVRSAASLVPGALFSGTGNPDFFIWGAQLEAGTFATSYIATVATAQTRAADSAVMTGTNFSSWFNNGEGTFYIDAIGYMPNSLGGNRPIVSVSDGTYNNFIFIAKASGQGAWTGDVYVNSSLQASLVTAYTINQNTKLALGYAVNNVNMAINGTALTNDNLALIPSVINRLDFRDPTGVAGGQPTGTIKKFAYYPARLTNAQLQALTQS